MSQGGEVTFSIADAFDPADEVARWLTALALLASDHARFVVWTEGAADDPTRLLAERLQAAALHEAARHLTKPVQRRARVAAFLAALPAGARADAERVRGAVDAASEHYAGDGIERLRSVTHHYSDVYEGERGAKQVALEHALARVQGRATLPAAPASDPPAFDFADAVAAQLLTELDGDGDRALALGERLREAGLALQRFAHAAISAHVGGRPASTG